VRTTIDLDDDLLLAAKEVARRQNLSLGQVISRLARRAMTIPVDSPPAESTRVAGFRPLPGRALVVGNDQVNSLRDAEGV
jgi:hypothetical protein